MKLRSGEWWLRGAVTRNFQALALNKSASNFMGRRTSSASGNHVRHRQQRGHLPDAHEPNIDEGQTQGRTDGPLSSQTKVRGFNEPVSGDNTSHRHRKTQNGASHADCKFQSCRGHICRRGCGISCSRKCQDCEV